MLVSLPVPVIILLDIAGWLVIHLGMAFGFTQLPGRLFKPEQWLFRPRRWERGGSVYARLFKVKRWKGYLPDGAALFAAGFRKRALAEISEDYYRQFIGETCRGEAVHWAVIACTPIFFVWNYWWADLVMVAYALAANLPCIITQRYNRNRLIAVLEHTRTHRLHD